MNKYIFIQTKPILLPDKVVCAKSSHYHLSSGYAESDPIGGIPIFRIVFKLGEAEREINLQKKTSEKCRDKFAGIPVNRLLADRFKYNESDSIGKP